MVHHALINYDVLLTVIAFTEPLRHNAQHNEITNQKVLFIFKQKTNALTMPLTMHISKKMDTLGFLQSPRSNAKTAIAKTDGVQAQLRLFFAPRAPLEAP